MHTSFCMSYLSASESHRNLNLATLFDKLSCCVNLSIKVVSIDIRRKSDLLNVNDFLFLSRFLFFSCLRRYRPARWLVQPVFLGSIVVQIAVGLASAALASSRASFTDMIPSCSPSAPITRTSLSRICSLINKSLIIIPPIIMQKVRAFSHKWYSSMGKKMEPIKGSTCLRSYIYDGTPSVLIILFITQADETP